MIFRRSWMVGVDIRKTLNWLGMNDVVGDRYLETYISEEVLGGVLKVRNTLTFPKILKKTLLPDSP